MKRLSSEPLPESKIQKIVIRPTQLANYLLNDHLIDWLNLYGKKESHTFSTFTRFLLEQGNKFEAKIIEHIRKNHPVVSISTRFSEKGVENTLKEIKKGTPLIHSAPLKSLNGEINGIADLLVRSDYLNKLVPNSITDDSIRGTEEPIRGGKYHYVVIDIKFSTLPLKQDERTILNQDRYRAYKSQVWLYSKMVGEITGYTPKFGYILGRGYKSCSSSSTNAFSKLGVIDFDEDNIKSITEDAIKWTKNMIQNGKNWNFQTNPELYPNMMGYMTPEKQLIAEQIGEITQIWNCGIEHRLIAHQAGITSWKNPNFTSELIGIKNTQQSEIINGMLNINRNTGVSFTRKNLFQIPKHKKEYFVDFENFTGVFDDFSKIPESNPLNLIFMISVASEEKGEINCTTFCVNSIDLNEEKRILNEFINFISEDSRLYHWSSAEPTIFTNALKKHSIPNPFQEEDKWFDLFDFFKKEQVCIRGCFSYSLKDIVRSLKKLNLISLEWNTQTVSGEDAMIQAYNEFSRGKTVSNSYILQDISNYNQTDCIVLLEILNFLRNEKV